MNCSWRVLGDLISVRSRPIMVDPSAMLTRALKSDYKQDRTLRCPPVPHFAGSEFRKASRGTKNKL
jgi:hypothetical protein